MTDDYMIKPKHLYRNRASKVTYAVSHIAEATWDWNQLLVIYSLRGYGTMYAKSETEFKRMFEPAKCCFECVFCGGVRLCGVEAEYVI